MGWILVEVLRRSLVSTLPIVLWAVGRLGDQNARRPLVQHYLRHEDTTVRSAAALALLRLGEPEALSYCMQCALKQPWPYLALGLAGGRSAVTTLLGVAATDQADATCLIALGLLGDIAAVAMLLTCLANPDLAEPAAKALYLLTAAPLQEEVFVPEPVDEDELFDEEKKKLKAGEPLTTAGGRPPGTTVVRLSQNPRQWQDWWDEHKRGSPRAFAIATARPIHRPACWRAWFRNGAPTSCDSWPMRNW